MIPASVDYVRAGSLEDALAALETPDAKVLAGGQSLLPAMKLRIARPAVLVDAGKLGLDAIGTENGTLAIGALATWRALEESELFRRPALAAIAECAAGIGTSRFGISARSAVASPMPTRPPICPRSRSPSVQRSWCDRETGSRELPAADLYVGPFTSTLGEKELITEIRIPLPEPGSGSAYVAVEHPASGFALAGAAALVSADGSRRIALTGVGAAPFVLEGEVADAEIYGDRFAPEEYRRSLAQVVVARAVVIAEQRAKEDGSWPR